MLAARKVDASLFWSSSKAGHDLSIRCALRWTTHEKPLYSGERSPNDNLKRKMRLSGRINFGLYAQHDVQAGCFAGTRLF
jgi:hypothetical protein